MKVICYVMIVLLIPLIAFVAGTLIVSRMYWGYWLGPPSSDVTVRDVKSVERFSTFNWDGTQSSGRAVLLAAASGVNYVSGDDPMGRLPAALVSRQLYPRYPQSVDPSLLPEIVTALDSLGKLVPASIEYHNTARLHGHLALASTRAGNRVVVVAFAGGEVSNDHYPYYEAVFAINPVNTVTLQQFHAYFFDVAGVEGFGHWLGGVLISIGASFVVAVAALIIHFRRGRLK